MTVDVRMCSSAAEERRSLEIYNEVWPHRAVSAENVDAWRRAARASVEFLGAVDDVDAGSAAVALETSRPGVAIMLVTVLPQLRRRGVGSALFDAASSWAVAESARELETFVDADDEESQGFAVRRDFREHSREVGLELTLDGVEPADEDPPAGVEIVSLDDRPDLAHGAYDVGREALPDVPGGEEWTPPPFEQFAATHLRGVILLAVADGEVVGYAKLVPRPDGRSADHGMTAVKRDRRGRGIATSLKRAQIAWAKAQGFERLTASNEERNAAMRRINASLGYRSAPGRVRLRATLGAG